MSESPGRKLRRRIVKRIREEGYQAALDGKHVQTNPYKYMDAYQWSNGYAAGVRELERRQEDETAE